MQVAEWASPKATGAGKRLQEEAVGAAECFAACEDVIFVGGLAISLGNFTASRVNVTFTFT
jgi:hypothetical protein